MTSFNCFCRKDCTLAAIIASLIIGVVGLGYVGLPLIVEKAKAGFKCIGFDVQQEKVDMVNAGKNPMFSLEERVELIRRITRDLPNVDVDFSGELLAEYARKKGKCVIVKGLRAGSGFEYEFQMALINRKINPKLETLFMPTSEENLYLSSSVVKEICSLGGDISPFVPETILGDVTKRLLRGE